MSNQNLTIENARLVFRNFSGKEGRFNTAGKRNFCVLLDEDSAKVLLEDGWNVKYLTPREEGDVPQAYMQVSINFNGAPPKIVLITSNGQTILTEQEVNILDMAEFEMVDLIIRPYNWEVNGKKGIKGYLRSMYATIVEDELERKYNGPDSAISSMIGRNIND